MPARRLRPSIVALVLVSALLLPPAQGHGPGNSASIDVFADDSAAAICQLVVLVDALIVLEPEDALALVAAPRTGQVDVVLPVEAPAPTARAECSVVIDQLAVSFPGAPSALARANHVTGPAPIGDERPGLSWRVNVTGAGSEARICQVVVILGSIIIGGAAFGIEQSDLPIIDANAVGDGAGPGGDARCRAAIGQLAVDGVDMGLVEASA